MVLVHIEEIMTVVNLDSISSASLSTSDDGRSSSLHLKMNNGKEIAVYGTRSARALFSKLTNLSQIKVYWGNAKEPAVNLGGDNA